MISRIGNACISPQAAKLKSDFGDEAPFLVDDHILYHFFWVSENGDAHILPFFIVPSGKRLHN